MKVTYLTDGTVAIVVDDIGTEVIIPVTEVTPLVRDLLAARKGAYDAVRTAKAAAEAEAKAERAAKKAAREAKRAEKRAERKAKLAAALAALEAEEAKQQ